MEHRELNPVLCDNLDRWDRMECWGERFKREGTYVYLWQILVIAWQKPTQHYKATIFQLNINIKKQILSGEGGEGVLYSWEFSKVTI